MSNTFRTVSRAHDAGTIVYSRLNKHRGKIIAQWDQWVWVLWADCWVPVTEERCNLVTDAPVTLDD